MSVREKALAAFSLLTLTAACGGTVVFEEDGGRGLAGQGGDGDGDGGSRSTSSADGGSSASTNPSSSGSSDPSSSGSNVTTNVSSGPTTNSGVGPGPSTGVSVGPTSTGVGPGPSTSTGFPGCGTLLDDLGGLGAGLQCDNCAEAACCGELARCTAGSSCWVCIFEGNCDDEAQDALNDLGDCISFECDGACNGGGCSKEEFRCFETGECLPFQLVCDGVFHCEDGSDESPDVCGGCGPGAFICNDGSCIPGEWVCDGIDDCPDDEDEFCGSEGICDSGLETGSPELDVCLGETCCFEFEQCTDFGEDVDACFNCLQNGGGPRCNDALECAQFSGCLDQPENGVCGTGVGFGVPELDECIDDNCCDSFVACVGPNAETIEACNECLQAGAGPLCDEFLTCANDFCT